MRSKSDTICIVIVLFNTNTINLILEEYTLLQKCLHWVVFLWAFVESGMVSATNFLNRYSRDYRYVLKTLGKERKILKVSPITIKSTEIIIPSFQAFLFYFSQSQFKKACTFEPKYVNLLTCYICFEQY